MVKIGFFGGYFGGDVGFWPKNGGWGVNLRGLGKIGKAETFGNVRKRLKIFENLGKIFENLCKTFENIRKYLKI